MGVLEPLVAFAEYQYSTQSTTVLALSGFAIFIVLTVVINVLQQLLLKNPNEPPMVFHWFPWIGSSVVYGIHPVKFFFKNQKKYGDVFTFVLLGKKTTVCLGSKGNNFILNAKHKDVNAEEVYSPLTTPVFGKDVVYDCPNAKLMEQKKFMKFGLTTEAFQSYVPLITKEVDDFIEHSKDFQGNAGRIEVGHTLAEITIYTASRTLQGKEVRDRFDSTFADLYHDLDMGFAPINFIWPSCPLPANKRRDQARETMKDLYSEIIRQRRERLAAGEKQVDQEKDMLWNLMGSEYKGGKQVPDYEIAHMMIALLMAGQHSSSSTSSWIMLRLASRPHIVEELYAEQVAVLGVGDNGKLRDLTYEDLPNLKLNQQVIKETLRMHAPIHSIMRAVTNPLSIEGTNWTIPAGHVILSSPGYSAMCEEYFPEPENWDPHRWDEDRMKAAMRAEEEEKIDYGYGLVSKGGNSPYLPFGAGRHRCIGEQFANLQLGVIIAALVRHLKLRSPLGKDEFIATDYSSLFSRPVSPAYIDWEKRTKA